MGFTSSTCIAPRKTSSIKEEMQLQRRFVPLANSYSSLVGSQASQHEIPDLCPPMFLALSFCTYAICSRHYLSNTNAFAIVQVCLSSLWSILLGVMLSKYFDEENMVSVRPAVRPHLGGHSLVCCFLQISKSPLSLFFSICSFVGLKVHSNNDIPYFFNFLDWFVYPFWGYLEYCVNF